MGNPEPLHPETLSPNPETLNPTLRLGDSAPMLSRAPRMDSLGLLGEGGGVLGSL